MQQKHKHTAKQGQFYLIKVSTQECLGSLREYHISVSMFRLLFTQFPLVAVLKKSILDIYDGLNCARLLGILICFYLADLWTCTLLQHPFCFGLPWQHAFVQTKTGFCVLISGHAEFSTWNNPFKVFLIL